MSEQWDMLEKNIVDMEPRKVEEWMCDRVRGIIGGVAVIEEPVRRIGGDAFAPGAIAGLSQVKEWL